MLLKYSTLPLDGSSERSEVRKKNTMNEEFFSNSLQHVQKATTYDQQGDFSHALEDYIKAIQAMDNLIPGILQFFASHCTVTTRSTDREALVKLRDQFSARVADLKSFVLSHNNGGLEFVMFEGTGMHTQLTERNQEQTEGG